MLIFLLLIYNCCNLVYNLKINMCSYYQLADLSLVTVSSICTKSFHSMHLYSFVHFSYHSLIDNQRVRCRESSIEIPITEECYILLFSLCWCKECRNYTCSKHICGGIPSFEKSFMLEGIPVINLVGKLRELKKRLECLDPWRIC
ncbi:uncharacterized protein LOC107429770 isoform X3 [Ziziphus jujuba]|uniref:Uncharacterized protein LOC107429770 isoform X3 n=1 Tax=Ziziphus jujuba TaxID=326968 RepID=A0ABM4AC99_ZIZJJ|nr:uncharacterized protein LOC107429770 isoform X3 [Ziziphus jujuba]